MFNFFRLSLGLTIVDVMLPISIEYMHEYNITILIATVIIDWYCATLILKTDPRCNLYMLMLCWLSLRTEHNVIRKQTTNKLEESSVTGPRKHVQPYHHIWQKEYSSKSLHQTTPMVWRDNRRKRSRQTETSQPNSLSSVEAGASPAIPRSAGWSVARNALSDSSYSA